MLSQASFYDDHAGRIIAAINVSGSFRPMVLADDQVAPIWRSDDLTSSPKAALDAARQQATR